MRARGSGRGRGRALVELGPRPGARGSNAAASRTECAALREGDLRQTSSPVAPQQLAVAAGVAQALVVVPVDIGRLHAGDIIGPVVISARIPSREAVPWRQSPVQRLLAIWGSRASTRARSSIQAVLNRGGSTPLKLRVPKSIGPMRTMKVWGEHRRLGLNQAAGLVGGEVVERDPLHQHPVPAQHPVHGAVELQGIERVHSFRCGRRRLQGNHVVGARRGALDEVAAVVQVDGHPRIVSQARVELGEVIEGHGDHLRRDIDYVHVLDGIAQQRPEGLSRAQGYAQDARGVPGCG